MRRLTSLIESAAALAIVVIILVLADRADAQPHWQVAEAAICGARHSYRFYQHFSSKFELDVAGPNDAIETSESVFRPETHKAETRSTWKSAIGSDAKPWQQLQMVATCEADPWLFPKSIAKCDGFQGTSSCANPPKCTPPNASPPFRVPAGAFKDKALPASAIPSPKIVAPTQGQAAMVLEVPVELQAGVPAAPYCAELEVVAKGPGGVTVPDKWPVTAGPTKRTLSLVGQPQGKWTLTATTRQYTGKPGAAAWTVGAPESREFYLGPSWPGTTQKPVSVTMLKVVSPAKGGSVPDKNGALIISVHQDLRNAANPKQARLTWQYQEALPGTPWPGTSVLPDVMDFPPQMKSPGAPSPEWHTYQKPLDFQGQTAHKSWKLRACVRAYDSDLCQEVPFTLTSP